MLNSSTVPSLAAGAAVFLGASGDGSLTLRASAKDSPVIKVYQSSDWEFVSSESIPVRVRKTPSWAIVLGVIGLLLLLFLIAALFFLVKENKTVMKPVLTISTSDGWFKGHREGWSYLAGTRP